MGNCSLLRSTRPPSCSHTKWRRPTCCHRVPRHHDHCLSFGPHARRGPKLTTETTVDAADLLEVGTAVQVENLAELHGRLRAARRGAASEVAGAHFGREELERVWFELRDAAGAALGLIMMKKCASETTVKDCVLLVCSTVPRVAGQAERVTGRCKTEGHEARQECRRHIVDLEKTFAASLLPRG